MLVVLDLFAIAAIFVTDAPNSMVSINQYLGIDFTNALGGPHALLSPEVHRGRRCELVHF